MNSEEHLLKWTLANNRAMRDLSSSNLPKTKGLMTREQRDKLSVTEGTEEKQDKFS